MTKNLERVPWLSALYLIFFGLLWMLNAGVIVSHRVSAPMIYEAGQEVLVEARNGLQYLQNEGPGDLTEHRVAYGDLQRALIKYKANYMDRTPIIVYVIGGLAIITSLVYMGAGVVLFSKNLGAAWLMLRLGMLGVCFNYGLMFLEYFKTGHELNTLTDRLLKVFGIKEGLSGVPKEILLFVGGFMLAALIFYIVFPMLIHRRLTRLSLSSIEQPGVNPT